MEILRKLKKLRKLRIVQVDNPSPPPLPNDRHQMRDEAVPPNMDYDPLPSSFFNAVNSAREQGGYDPLPVFPHGGENLMYEHPGGELPRFNRSRSKSRERPLDRSVRHRSRGTPVKFRRRPISPELLQPRASSPFLFHQHSLPASPDMHHRFQHAQQFQHFPREQQFDMRMAHPIQFVPQFQQPFYPNFNMQPWFMMSQPQMYPFF